MRQRKLRHERQWQLARRAADSKQSMIAVIDDQRRIGHEAAREHDLADLRLVPRPEADAAQRIRLVSRVIRVNRPIAVSDFDAATAGEVLVGRIERNGEQYVAESTSSLEPGDLVGLIGPAAMVERVTPLVGERTTGRLLPQ